MLTVNHILIQRQQPITQVQTDNLLLPLTTDTAKLNSVIYRTL